MKLFILALGVVLIVVSVLFAQDLRVKEVIGMEVIIEDRATGEEWRVLEGETVGEGWKAIKITEQLVTIEKERSDGTRLRAELPVKRLNTLEIPSQQ